MNSTTLPTTDELYRMQRGKDGKFTSGKRINNIELPVGFYQENKTLILNYYDSSDKYISVLEVERKEEFSAMLKECLYDFDRAMHSPKFREFSELIKNSMRLLDKNKHNIEDALRSFIQKPSISTSFWMLVDEPVILTTFDKFSAVIDTQCQIIIVSLLTSYKYDNHYFPRENDLFQNVDYILQQVKKALLGYLLGTDGVAPTHSATHNIIYSRLAELIKNGSIDENSFSLLSDIISLSPFSMLKQIIDNTEIVPTGYYCQGISEFRMSAISTISKPEMLLNPTFTDDDTSDDLIFKALLTMYKKVKSISDTKEYLLATVVDSAECDHTEENDIIDTLLLNLDVSR